jgi:hypothetical protein
VPLYLYELECLGLHDLLVRALVAFQALTPYLHVEWWQPDVRGCGENPYYLRNFVVASTSWWLEESGSSGENWVTHGTWLWLVIALVVVQHHDQKRLGDWELTLVEFLCGLGLHFDNRYHSTHRLILGRFPFLTLSLCLLYLFLMLWLCDIYLAR